MVVHATDTANNTEHLLTYHVITNVTYIHTLISAPVNTAALSYKRISSLYKRIVTTYANDQFAGKYCCFKLQIYFINKWCTDYSIKLCWFEVSTQIYAVKLKYVSHKLFHKITEC